MAVLDGEAAQGENDEEGDVLGERRRNLEILQSIVGSSKVKVDHPTSARAKDKKLADTSAAVFR